MRTQHDLRCVCSRRPLLLKYGVDDGQVYVWLRVFKGNQVYGEIVVYGGAVRVHCRSCLRWFRVDIRRRVADVVETVEPSLTVVAGGGS